MSSKISLVVAFVGACVLSGAAFAAAPQSAMSSHAKKAPTAQQQKMGACSHESKGMKGDAHKKFLRDCMKGKTHMSSMSSKKHMSSSMSAKTMQRQKMKDCNMQAKGKKGTLRKSFMSNCLKKH